MRKPRPMPRFPRLRGMRRGIEPFQGSVAICAQYGAARMANSLGGVGPPVPGCRRTGADSRPPPAEWHQASGRRGAPGGGGGTGGAAPPPPPPAPPPGPPPPPGPRLLARAGPRGGGALPRQPPPPPHALARARRLPGWIHDDGFDAGRPDIDAEEPGEGRVDQKKPRTAKAIVRLRWMNERNMSGSTI